MYKTNGWATQQQLPISAGHSCVMLIVPVMMLLIELKTYSTLRDCVPNYF